MPFIIAQFSDCHLFSIPQTLHCGANVDENLSRVLNDLAHREDLDAMVFTGDLSQDHTERSYQRFSELVSHANIVPPLYYLAGNHDCPKLLEKYLAGKPFCSDNVIITPKWKIDLLCSKSATPAGFIEPNDIEKLLNSASPDKHQWLFMHHHPIDVGYFIDRHHLINQAFLWGQLEQLNSLKGIACGHVHRGLDLLSSDTGKCCDVLTCPATSIQFDPNASTLSALPVGPGYRIIELYDDGSYKTQIHFLS